MSVNRIKARLQFKTNKMAPIVYLQLLAVLVYIIQA